MITKTVAHDVKGQPLKVGSRVNVPCRVEAIDNQGVTLRTSHVCPGEVEGNVLTLHAAQTKKSEAKS